MVIETKTVYICDNCDKESTLSHGWIKFRKPLMGQYYLSKNAIFDSTDCLDAWLLKFARDNTMKLTESDTWETIVAYEENTSKEPSITKSTKPIPA